MHLTKGDLEVISDTRLQEAKALYEQGYYDGAKYLLGYVVETALKAVICKTLNAKTFPPGNKRELKKVFYTHDINNLVVLAGLEKALEEQKEENFNFNENWDLLETYWYEGLRYSAIGSSSKEDLERWFEAIESSENSILNWLKSKW